MPENNIDERKKKWRKEGTQKAGLNSPTSLLITTGIYRSTATKQSLNLHVRNPIPLLTVLDSAISAGNQLENNS